MAQPTGLTVYSIGHSNRDADDLVGALLAHGIGAVVDVRSVPFSQYTPQFNRDAIEPRLGAAGIAYHFAGKLLGGRPDDPTCYHAGAVPDAGADFLGLVDYDEVAKRPWYRRGLDRLVEIAGTRRTAMMCSEEDPARCHRQHLIAQSLLDRGIAVGHIRRDGSVDAATARTRQLSLLP
jgi:uncharacterized protein (DUF488 family)